MKTKSEIPGWFRYQLVLCLLMVLCRAGFAQDTGASLLGVVRDSGGATISSATVAATNSATDARTVVTTNQKGEYLLLNLPPGTYSLEVKAIGFEALHPNRHRS